MVITTVTSRQFNQDVSKIKQASLKGPIFITDRGNPAYVLLAIKDYEQLITKENVIDLLAMENPTDIDFKPPKMRNISRPVNFN